jgi:hypothetical protein
MAALAWGCGGTTKDEGDADDDPAADGEDTSGDASADSDDDVVVDSDEDVPVDAPVDTEPGDVPTDSTGCTDGEMRCNSDDTAIEECVDGAWVTTDCYFGCVADPTPRCREWDISNVDDDSLLTLGEPYCGDPWPSDTASQYDMRMDTDTGQIDIYVWDTDSWVLELEMRPADRGLNPGTGIGFTVVDQGTDLPELGVFSFQQFNVPENYIVTVWGTRPLVILSEEASTIEGGVYAGCNWETGEAFGGANYSDEGAGAGGPGDSVGASGGTRDGGGGGGAYGGIGGTGGGYDTSLRGVGGSTYGTDELIPLLAGSGGGRGAGTGGSRWGGRSGGAVQLVSGDTLTITGWVDASGCGGRTAERRSPEGGGGGGSGGGILLEAPAVIVTGEVTANGGGGAGGGRGSEAENGEDGHVAEDTAALGGTTTSSAACAGGNGNGAGGADGEDAPTCDGDPGLYNAGGGGAGGGRIRINGISRILTSGLFSPGTSAACVTEGDLVLI